MKKTITKKDFIKQVANLTSKDPKELTNVIQAVFDAISDVMVDGNRLEVRNFGVFYVKKRKPRIGCDPNNPKQKINIPASATPAFKPGKLLKQRVNEKNK